MWVLEVDELTLLKWHRYATSLLGLAARPPIDVLSGLETDRPLTPSNHPEGRSCAVTRSRPTRRPHGGRHRKRFSLAGPRPITGWARRSSESGR